MGPVRGNKKKRKTEKKVAEKSLGFSESSQEEGSAEWWDVLSNKIAGNPSTSQEQDNFQSTLKMSRKTFDYVCSLVKDHITSKTHFSFTNGKPMSINSQVAVALRRLSSGNSLISIGDSFGVHHSTVSQITWRFIEAIEEKGLHHLQWPSTEIEMAQIKFKFEKIRGLPNCCGAIDSTHITMLLTSSDPEADSWVDQKENHSMILQAIVDPDLRFLDVVAGCPGRMNDALVLQSSSFFKQCANGERLNGGKISLNEGTELREYVVGDLGFPLLPWLVTPYQGKGELKESKVEFNKRLLATQFVAQKALVRLKETWRIIKGDMWRPDKHKLPRFILACCILHNIVIEMKGGDLEEFPPSIQHDPGYRQEVCDSVDKRGLVLRDKLSKYFSGR